VGSGLRFWPHLSRRRSNRSPAAPSHRHASESWVRGARHVVPSGRSILTGRTATCKAQAFALLRAGGLANFSPSRSLRLTGKTSRPGLAFRGPLAGSYRRRQEGKNNGGNDAIQRSEAAIVAVFVYRVMYGVYVMDWKRRSVTLSLAQNHSRQVAQGENQHECAAQCRLADTPAQPGCNALTALLTASTKDRDTSRRPHGKKRSATYRQAGQRTVRDCRKLFRMTWHKGNHGSNI